METIDNHELIEKYILEGEHVMQDFKQQITNTRKIAKTIVAFANNKGGRIIIGVDDFGDIVGVDVEEEVFMIEEAAEHYCDPPVDVRFVIHEHEGIEVVEVNIPNSLKKPHAAQEMDGTWTMYIRSNDQCRILTKTSLKSLSDDDEPTDESKLDSKERALLQLLRKRNEIGIGEYARHINISFRRARRMMFDLTNKGYLLHHQDERGDYFTLK